MASRNPYSDDPGFVCARKCPDGGYAVVYDRDNGGDWIDGETRWVLAKFSPDMFNQGILDLPTKADAIGMMRETAAGADDWYEPMPSPAQP